MKEITGDLFDYPVIVIPTNGVVKADGRLVMGAGVAKQAKDRYLNLDLYLGYQVSKKGNSCYVFCNIDTFIISFPTKDNYITNSYLRLIEKSTKVLVEITDWFNLEKVYLPKVGCGYGNLNWETEVKPLLSRYLDDRFIIVTKDG